MLFTTKLNERNLSEEIFLHCRELRLTRGTWAMTDRGEDLELAPHIEVI